MHVPALGQYIGENKERGMKGDFSSPNYSILLFLVTLLLCLRDTDTSDIEMHCMHIATWCR